MAFPNGQPIVGVGVFGMRQAPSPKRLMELFYLCFKTTLGHNLWIDTGEVKRSSDGLTDDDPPHLCKHCLRVFLSPKALARFSWFSKILVASLVGFCRFFEVPCGLLSGSLWVCSQVDVPKLRLEESSGGRPSPWPGAWVWSWGSVQRRRGSSGDPDWVNADAESMSISGCKMWRQPVDSISRRLTEKSTQLTFSLNTCHWRNF